MGIKNVGERQRKKRKVLSEEEKLRNKEYDKKESPGLGIPFRISYRDVRGSY